VDVTLKFAGAFGLRVARPLYRGGHCRGKSNGFRGAVQLNEGPVATLPTLGGYRLADPDLFPRLARVSPSRLGEPVPSPTHSLQRVSGPDRLSGQPGAGGQTRVAKWPNADVLRLFIPAVGTGVSDSPR
jgi:hypothetical protein